MSRTNGDGKTEWLLVQPTWLIFGMRELFEIELSAKPMDQSYMKQRGELLERRGMRALVEALRPDAALVNVEYVDGQHKRFEADGLILVGHVAIVLEAKSNRITPLARSGAAERLCSNSARSSQRPLSKPNGSGSASSKVRHSTSVALHPSGRMARLRRLERTGISTSPTSPTSSPSHCRSKT